MTANHEAKLTPTTARLLVEALKSLKWKSICRDNMEFQCTTTCYVMDNINEALSAAERELEGT